MLLQMVASLNQLQYEHTQTKYMAANTLENFSKKIDTIFAKVPYLNIPDTPIVRNAQDFVPIADIADDIILYKDGGAAIVLESTSLNFGLLSEREQEAVITAYAALINSLSFATQIVIRTQRKDISKYLVQLDQKIAEQKNLKLKELMVGYKRFIEETIKRRNVLGKRFFIVIPLSPLELGFTKSMFPGMANKTQQLSYSKSYILKKAKVVLIPKRDHIIKQTARLGLKAKQLDRKALIELYYEMYNPDVESVREKPEVKEV